MESHRKSEKVSVRQNKHDGDRLKEILHISRGFAVPMLQSSPRELLHTFYKTLDTEDHKNEAHHSLDVFRHMQPSYRACWLFYLDLFSYFLPQAPSYT